MLIACPSCGREVELFSDEPQRRCRCGHVVTRQALPSCADWCPAAGECFPHMVDPEAARRRATALREDPRAKKHVERICRQIRESCRRKGG